MTTSVRALWVAITVLLSAMTGTGGGALAAMDGASLPRAVMTGAATFAATVTLAMIILAFFVSPTQRSDNAPGN